MINNKSKEEHNIEQLMESCEITSTKVKRRSKDSKQMDNSEESDTDIFPRTETMSSAEFEELDCNESIELIEVTSKKNKAKIIFATDDFYGVAENLLKDDDPVCNKHTFFDNKINNNVDGWKTQKIRHNKNNFVIIQLAGATDIHSICIDTTCFTDPYISQFSVQGELLSKLTLEKTYMQNRKELSGKCRMKEYMYMENETKKWDYLISRQKLNPGYPSIRKKFFKILPHNPVTHLRLNLFPDGGIARLRAYGRVIPTTITTMNREINLISSVYNSDCVSFSESYIGHPNNIIQPNKATSIIDGWVTARKHNEYYEISDTFYDEIMTEHWALFKLGCSGTVTRIVIDTRLFTGNAPFMVQVQGLYETDGVNTKWKNIIPRTYINPGMEQNIIVETNRRIKVTSVKIIIGPDGGISRFRVFGIPEFNA
nr:PREDICTED: probable allantoicase isoform X1 [Linepithema humile]